MLRLLVRNGFRKQVAQSAWRQSIVKVSGACNRAIFLRMFRRAVLWSALTIVSAALAYSAVQNEKSIELPEGQGKKILETACVTCHGLDKVADKVGLTREAWREVVQNMVSVGADLKDDQISVLAEYLAA